MQYTRTLLVTLLLAAPAFGGTPRVLHATRTAPPGIVAPTVELAMPKTVPVGPRQVRFYQQQIAGVPVLGCGIDEVVDADGVSSMRNATLCATAATAPTSVASANAAAIARAAIVNLHPAQRYVVGDAAPAYRAAGSPLWLVDVATSDPWNLWRVFVDGTDGSVLRVTTTAKDARGFVFPTPGAVAKHQPIARKLRDLDPGTRTLSGDDFLVDDINDFLARCDVTNNLFCAPAGADTCAAVSKHGNYQYSAKAPVQIGSCTQNDRFDQVTAYYDLSEMSHYFRELGWELGSGALAGSLPLPVLVNLPYLINAYFSPPTPNLPAHIAFGDEQAGVELNDFTNDPTIPRHELTHAIVEDAAGGISDDNTCLSNCSPYSGAMNEGFADYFAIQSLGGKQTIIGSQAGKAIADQLARDINNELRFPCDLKGEVHDDGRLWSGFLRDVKGVIGRGFDSAVVRSIANIPHGLGYSLGFGEAFEAVLEELPPLSEKATIAIVQHGTRRGVLGAFAKDRGPSVTIDSGDSAWLCPMGNVCGLRDDGGASAAVVNTNPGFPGGLAARTILDPTAPLDLRGQQLLHFVMYGTPTPAAGAVSLVFDDNLDCASPSAVIPLPAFDANGFTERYLQFTDTDTLGSVVCVGLIAPPGAAQFLIDTIDTGISRFGPVVLPIEVSKQVTLKNYFPLPAGDTHFYYFLPPPGATAITVKAQASGLSHTRSDLAACGAVHYLGSGDVKAEISSMHLWTYDPSQPILPTQVTLLPLDSHQLVAGIPAVSGTKRAVKSLPLPPSPTGVYAVSLDGAANYTVKLSFN